jgi:hypothetical protein
MPTRSAASAARLSVLAGGLLAAAPAQGAGPANTLEELRQQFSSCLAKTPLSAGSQVEVSLARLRAGCRVRRRLSGLASVRRARAMERREGNVRPTRQGGDRHSQRIEAHAELILSAVAAKSDITLAELQEPRSAASPSPSAHSGGSSSVARSRAKKSRRTPPNSAATR